MKHSHMTQGTCSGKIDFELDDDHKVRNVKFYGGCGGNTKAISAMVEGVSAEEVIARLQGIQCRGGTSCPDQLACALKKVLANE